MLPVFIKNTFNTIKNSIITIINFGKPHFNTFKYVVKNIKQKKFAVIAVLPDLRKIYLNSFIRVYFKFTKELILFQKFLQTTELFYTICSFSSKND